MRPGRPLGVAARTSSVSRSSVTARTRFTMAWASSTLGWPVTVTTVCGILPTAYGIGGLDKFVVPIALALGWGVFFGSILATMGFPAVLAIFDDVAEFFTKRFGEHRTSV